jgi:hypothetical protein
MTQPQLPLPTGKETTHIIPERYRVAGKKGLAKARAALAEARNKSEEDS